MQCVSDFTSFTLITSIPDIRVQWTDMRNKPLSRRRNLNSLNNFKQSLSNLRHFLLATPLPGLQYNCTLYILHRLIIDWSCHVTPLIFYVDILRRWYEDQGCHPGKDYQCRPEPWSWKTPCIAHRDNWASNQHFMQWSTCNYVSCKLQVDTAKPNDAIGNQA